VLEQTDEAIRLLTASTADRERVIRNSRVCCKKIRGVVRLVRKEIGAEVFELEDRCFRDARRALAPASDSESVDCILDVLRGRLSDGRCGPWLELVGGRPSVEVKAKDGIDDEVIASVASTLAIARQRVGEWPFTHEGFSIVAGGLKRCYKDGSNCCYVSLDQPSSRNLREWHKQVTYLRYQLTIFRPVWPKVLGSLADQLKRLGEYLNEYGDLIVLREGLSRSQPLDAAEIEGRMPRIERRCRELERKAVAVAHRVYAESPKAFVHRMNEYWSAWRLEGARKSARHGFAVEAEDSQSRPDAT